MIRINQLSTFNKATIMLLTGIAVTSLCIPYAMAETKATDIKMSESKTNEVVAEMPADNDFKKLDVNSDKKISLKEAVKDKTLATSFDMTDINKDGNITADEYSSYKASSMKNLDNSAAPSAAPPSAVTPTTAPTTP